MNCIEHSAVTSREYADGLINSRKKNLTIFVFLLARADRCDLGWIKGYEKYEEDPDFGKAIDDVYSEAEPAGARHDRFFNRERVGLAMETFSETESTESSGREKELGGIIFDYLG